MIDFSIEEGQSLIDFYESCIKELEDRKKNAQDAFKGLTQSDWSGKARDTAIVRFDKWLKQIDGVISRLISLQDVLKDCHLDFTEREKQSENLSSFF